ncbi:MAG: hypothetical protein AABX96_01570 [Nanoarchaeota archaeon]
MKNRNTGYEISATVDGKPVAVTRLTHLENFRLFSLAERTIRGEFDDLEIYLAFVAPNTNVIKMRYHERL